jgi:phosphoenolpyruvate carboxykinase (ATP)
MRPRDTWKDPAAYDAQAKKLAEMFRKNLDKFGDRIDARTKAAGPRG